MSSAGEPKERGNLILMGRLLAAVDQLAHTGMTEFEIRYDDDLGDLNPVEVLWIAEGNWKGTRVFSAHFAYPAQAAEDLMAKIINGGMCTSCGKTTVAMVDIPGYCARLLTATNVDDDKSYRYVRKCGAHDGPSREQRRKKGKK